MFRVSWQLSETEHIISNGLLPALTTMVRQHITTTNGLVDEALALHRTVEVSPVTSLLAWGIGDTMYSIVVRISISSRLCAFFWLCTGAVRPVL